MRPAKRANLASDCVNRAEGSLAHFAGNVAHNVWWAEIKLDKLLM